MLTTQNHGVKNGVDRKCVHQSFYTVPKPKEGKAEMGAGRGRHEGRGKKRVRWWVKASVERIFSVEWLSEAYTITQTRQ